MTKKFGPGEMDPELPALKDLGSERPRRPGPGEKRPRPLEHPSSLRERIEAPPSAYSLPLLDGIVMSPRLHASPLAPPSPPRRFESGSADLGLGEIRTELPDLSAFTTSAFMKRPDTGPEGPRATGTTTLGITTKDACVLGTDHRASAGRLVSHTDTQKLFRIDGHLGMTIAGLVGDAQDLVRTITAEAKVFSMKNDRPMPVAAAAARMANLLNAHKFTPFEVALVLGGMDRNGAHVYSLDEAGGSIPDKWVTTGSGSPFVYGVLEDRYKDDLSMSDAVDLALHGLNAATRRDSASGNGFDVATIDKHGFQWVPREETDRRLKKLGLPPIPK